MDCDVLSCLEDSEKYMSYVEKVEAALLCTSSDVERGSKQRHWGQLVAGCNCFAAILIEKRKFTEIVERRRPVRGRQGISQFSRQGHVRSLLHTTEEACGGVPAPGSSDQRREARAQVRRVPREPPGGPRRGRARRPRHNIGSVGPERGAPPRVRRVSQHRGERRVRFEPEREEARAPVA